MHHIPILIRTICIAVVTKPVRAADPSPQVAKGARDFLPDQMAIRESAFGIITNVFKRHGELGYDYDPACFVLVGSTVTGDAETQRQA